MSKDFIATIREGCPRYADWLAVLGTNEVAIQSPQPHLASAPGIEAAPFFLIDLAELTAEQRARLIKHLAQRFQVPEAEVERDLDAVGCPILDEDVTVTVFHPWRWL